MAEERICVRIASSDVKDYMNAFSETTFNLIREIHMEKLPSHYNVAGSLEFNTKRLAAVAAVISQPENPVITREIYDWSIRFNMLSVTNTIRQFPTRQDENG